MIFILFLSCLDNFILTTFLLSWEFFLPWKFLFRREIFILPWEFFYCLENFYFALRIFLLPWELLFCCENFSFDVRIFLFLENFSFAERARTFFLKVLLSVERIFFLKAKTFGNPYKKALVGCVVCAYCCEQDLFIF